MRDDDPAPPPDEHESKTLPPLTTREEAYVAGRTVALTILCHPDPGRIGEVARFAELERAGAASLSRVEPRFCKPGSPDAGAALEDPFISRKPVTLTRLADGRLRVEGELEHRGLVVEGEPVVEPRILEAEALEDGVVLELARRVVLLLHWGGPPTASDSDLGFVGASEAIERVRVSILDVARTDAPVLLVGESGTGKELVASAIHRTSARANQPFLTINMAAIPASMAAAELFGHARGAFTGAVADAEGYFSRADRGTLFLDEVGDTPLDVQVMLLRVLETGEIQPIGAHQVRKVDVRLIAATESDLNRAVIDGRLRLSFLQRLSGFQIEVPPLRKRRDDFGRLFVHYLREELRRLDAEVRLSPPVAREVRPWLPASLVARLAKHSWPGNIRQLRNVARQLVVTYRAQPMLQLDATVEHLLGVAGASRRTITPESPLPGPLDSPAEESAAPARLEEIDEARLKAALAACDYQPAAAARLLGIGRTSLYKLMSEARSIRKASDVPADEVVASHEKHGGDLAAMARELEVSPRALKLRLTQLGLAARS
jgi:two-component system, NtrC family, nitrogen regulation response regulator GlnG